MRNRLVADSRSPRLLVGNPGDRPTLWTAALGIPPSVHGEATRADGETVYRRWDPSRSKLAAAVVRGYSGDLPTPGERWLYLGGATGTTATHVADLVGTAGLVVAVEVSPRSFVRLLSTAQTYPNLWPVLGDARRPETFAGLVPPVDGLYCDVAQPDQVEVVMANADWFLQGPRKLVVALKTASLGRDRPPEAHLTHAEHQLGRRFRLAPAVRLDPIHRRHYLLGTSHSPPTSHGRGGEPEPRRRRSGHRGGRPR